MTSLIVATVAIVAFALGALVGALLMHKMDRSMHDDREALFNAELSAMKSQFEAVSARLLKERSEEFKGENKAMTRILRS